MCILHGAREGAAFPVSGVMLDPGPNSYVLVSLTAVTVRLRSLKTQCISIKNGTVGYRKMWRLFPCVHGDIKGFSFSLFSTGPLVDY